MGCLVAGCRICEICAARAVACRLNDVAHARGFRAVSFARNVNDRGCRSMSSSVASRMACFRAVVSRFSDLGSAQARDSGSKSKSRSSRTGNSVCKRHVRCGGGIEACVAVAGFGGCKTGVAALFNWVLLKVWLVVELDCKISVMDTVRISSGRAVDKS